MSAAMSTTYRPHPVALIFPMMSPAELEALAVDIAEHGQAHPIVVMGDVLIDGRNRLAACERADVSPIVEEWRPRHEGDTPESYIISANLPRRHMNEGQRAAAAADFADYLRKERKARGQDANLHPALEPQAQAAASFNVSQRSVAAAEAVKRNAAPELAAAVREGRVSVSAAAKATKAPKAEQRKAAEKGKAAVVALAKKAAPEPQRPRTINVPLDVAEVAAVLRRAFTTEELRELAALLVA